MFFIRCTQWRWCLFMIIKTPWWFSQYWHCWLYCSIKFKEFLSRAPVRKWAPCISLPMWQNATKSGTFHPQDGNILSGAKGFLLAETGGYWWLGHNVLHFNSKHKQPSNYSRQVLSAHSNLKSLFNTFLFSNGKCKTDIIVLHRERGNAQYLCFAKLNALLFFACPMVSR